MNPVWGIILILFIVVLGILAFVVFGPSEHQRDNAVVASFPGSIIYKVGSQRYVAIDTVKSSGRPWVIFIEANSLIDSTVTSIKIIAPIK